MRFGNFRIVKFLTVTLLFAAAVLTITGCNRVPKGKAPEMDAVFDRFDQIELGRSTSTDVLAFIHNESMGEMLSQDEQTVVSWGQSGTGAVIWLNAATFDDTSSTAARKYALLVDEDSPRWAAMYGAKSRKMRVEFEYVLPPEFDELEFTNENERRREAIKSGLSLYLNDINIVRYDSDYIYTTALMLRQMFNELLYQAERVPANLSLIDDRKGMEFDHPTLGKGRIRMLINNKTYAVRMKIKIGSSVKSFAKDADVIAMDWFVSDEQRATAAAPTEKTRPEAAASPKRGFFDAFRPKPKRYTPEELQQIEEMAKKKAAADIAEMKEQLDKAVEESDEAQDKAPAEAPAETPVTETETDTAPVIPQAPDAPVLPAESDLPAEPTVPEQPGQIGQQ